MFVFSDSGRTPTGGSGVLRFGVDWLVSPNLMSMEVTARQGQCCDSEVVQSVLGIGVSQEELGGASPCPGLNLMRMCCRIESISMMDLVSADFVKQTCQFVCLVHDLLVSPYFSSGHVPFSIGNGMSTCRRAFGAHRG